MKKIIWLILLSLFSSKVSNAQYTINYAGNFNGFSSYVSVPSTAGLSPSAGVTLEAWVYPTQLLGSTMAVIGKNYQSSYFLGIQSSGRVVFYPKGGASFRSRVTGVIPVNQWTHIAGTYDGATTRIYINGVLDTSSTGFTGSVGVNSDSLFIGADRVGATITLFFKGRLDNVRIWGTGRTASQVSSNRFSPTEILNPTGDYTNLKASFQLDNSALNYGGSELNIGYERNMSYINYSNKEVNYLDYNNNLVLNGSTDYFTHSNNSGFNATNSITLEAWIRRDTTGSQPAIQNIINKSGGSTRYNYALYISSSGQLVFDINSGNNVVSSLPVITSSQWTHVAATYNTTDGYAILYINGVYQTSSLFAGKPPIANDPDNLYIGGIGATSYASNKFKGQIDAVRIWKTLRTPDEIKENIYKTIYNSSLANFEFDKNANSLRIGNSIILVGGVFAGSAHLSSEHLQINTQSASPVLSYDSEGFYSTNYFLNYNSFYIPDGLSSSITDSLYIPQGASISNLKVFVLMSHPYISDMSLSLTSPQGTTVSIFYRRGDSGNDMMTLFSDDADSVASLGTLVNERGINPPFSPSVKPYQSLSNFIGQNQQGWWKMRFEDVAIADRGYLHKWGMKILSAPLPKTLKLTSLIQGFYNNITDKMVRDTVKVFLKNANSPYSNLDSSKAFVDSLGKGNFPFAHISGSDVFYIVVKHRNSVETWSSGGYIFTTDTLYNNFTLANSQAFGSNQILVHTSPNRSAIYSGDINQDGVVDVTDAILVFNDALNSVSGYVKTDVNGDNIIDVSDATIVDNNSFNGVSVIKP